MELEHSHWGFFILDGVQIQGEKDQKFAFATVIILLTMLDGAQYSLDGIPVYQVGMVETLKCDILRLKVGRVGKNRTIIYKGLTMA